MKVIIILCYLIFLNVYIIKANRLLNNNKTTTTPADAQSSSSSSSSTNQKSRGVSETLLVRQRPTSTAHQRPRSKITNNRNSDYDLVTGRDGSVGDTYSPSPSYYTNTEFISITDPNEFVVDINRSNSKSRFPNNHHNPVEQARGNGDAKRLQYGLKTIPMPLKIPTTSPIPPTTPSATTKPTTASTGKSSVLRTNPSKNDLKRQAAATRLSSISSTSRPKLSSSTERKKQAPKKYIPSTTIKAIQYQDQQVQQSNGSKGPTKITLSKSIKLAPPSDTLVCPKETEATFNLFALPCKTDRDCTSWNKENRCCTLFNSRNCHRGVRKPIEEQTHKPILGLIPHKCPQRPLAELWWDLKTCKTDEDCWPRVCCPDGRNQYCRTSSPEYEAVPFQIGRPLAYFSEYLECTPPPPPIFDLHPKSCETTFDCFPNVCCQEAGKKNCRPPKKSVLTFMANFLNTGLLKRLTNNFVIR